MKDYQPQQVSSQISNIKIQSKQKPVFLELGEIYEGGENEVEKRDSIRKTKNPSPARI